MIPAGYRILPILLKTAEFFRKVTSGSNYFPSVVAYVIWKGQGVTRAHTLESQVHTGTNLHHFFHAESPAHTSHGIGWGGVGMMTFFALAHMFKARAMDCFGTYFTHVQTCNVTRVQSATEWYIIYTFVQTCNVIRV